MSESMIASMIAPLLLGVYIGWGVFKVFNTLHEDKKRKKEQLKDQTPCIKTKREDWKEKR